MNLPWRLQLVSLSVVCGIVGCRPPTHSTLEQRLTPAAQPESLELAWLPDGSRVAVAARWLFDPESGTFVSLKCSLAGGAACRTELLSFAPSGRRYAVVDADQLAIGDGERALADWKQIPRWLAPDAVPGASDTRVNVAFWLAPEVLFVQQFFADGHAEPECRLYELATGAWRRPEGGCLSPDFSYLARVDAGPNGLFALHSSAEGHFGFSVVHYDATRGQAPARVAFVLEGASSVHARFDSNGSRIELISPCALHGKPVPACDAPDRQRTWKLYAAPMTSGELRLERDDLPPGAVVDATSRRFAWADSRGLCVGDPRDQRARCVTLPRR